jgi:hypothetical protein
MDIKKNMQQHRNSFRAKRGERISLKHNSLQHDSTMAIPLLEVLIDKIKKSKHDPREVIKTLQRKPQEAKKTKSSKDAKEETTEATLEEVAEDFVEITDESSKKKDAVAALADRIKKMYAGEMLQQSYNQAQSAYNANVMGGAYGGNNVKQNSQMYNKQGYDGKSTSSAEAQNNGSARLDDESSKAYRLSGGSKMQAFIMTDPKGRLHSTWNVVRVFNESYDGKLIQNNGLHYQGLS